jgi:flagellin
MVINHNLSASFANRLLNFREVDLNKDIEKLSSGMRINRGGDDASGLAVSEKLRAQIRGLNMAERNISNAVSFIQTAEGFLAETQSVLQRIRELAVQSANGLYTLEDRMQIQVEVSQLVDEIDRIASHAQFNGLNILTGQFANASAGGGGQAVFFQVGANIDQRESAFIGTMTAQALGLVDAQDAIGGIISISTPDQANRAIGIVDQALTVVSKQRADLGAFQNRFEMAAQGVAVAAENLTAAESLVRDTDIAAQMVEFVKNQILTQSNTAMLAQANLKPQSMLTLFG